MGKGDLWKKKMSKTDRLLHIQRWRTSGLTRADYCRQADIKYGTFLTWLKLEALPSGDGNFIALSKDNPEHGEVEILFPNGIQLRYRGRVDEGLIKALQDA